MKFALWSIESDCYRHTPDNDRDDMKKFCIKVIHLN